MTGFTASTYLHLGACRRVKARDPSVSGAPFAKANYDWNEHEKRMKSGDQIWFALFRTRCVTTCDDESDPWDMTHAGHMQVLTGCESIGNRRLKGVDLRDEDRRNMIKIIQNAATAWPPVTTFKYIHICNIMQYHAMGKASRLRFHMVQESWEKRGWHTTSNAAGPDHKLEIGNTDEYDAYD